MSGMQGNGNKLRKNILHQFLALCGRNLLPKSTVSGK